MAHFAQLDENNVVTQVIVVSNEDTSDVNGNEVEEIGVAFCKKLLGADTNWKQTSYNNNMRVRYAGIGYSYNEAQVLGNSSHQNHHQVEKGTILYRFDYLEGQPSFFYDK